MFTFEDAVRITTPPKELRPQPQLTRLAIVDATLAAQRAAFEFGFRCAEKGMNLQAALERFDNTMKD